MAQTLATAVVVTLAQSCARTRLIWHSNKEINIVAKYMTETPILTFTASDNKLYSFSH